ncbi:inositol polyphosphate 1-phosphatase-like [Alosa sapidissima]|uniref:inositol polyphosphate 1-phosphatase-like n=1 Tax=Alosa sapidissima TaxID=34773 RepID=UPI001C0818F8|nr:inositol polyphosphate 1-phosphatase-like [Alosa sapidissima]
MSELMVALVQASEKAANIARSCRQDETLFSLLIEEKKSDKNKKFSADFKTLADVLVQEVIKHDIGKRFPGLENNIFGEETNEFMNGLGERIQVMLCERDADTARLLSKVLDGNMQAAEALASAAHQDVIIPDLQTGSVHIPIHNLGVWVDPIDSTLQYIKGISNSVPEGSIYSRGLQCVTVLIGAYDLQTGEPLMGVINQPFAEMDDSKRWQGRFFWGISAGPLSVNSLSSTPLTRGDSTHPLPTPNPVADPSLGVRGSKLSTVLSTREVKRVKALFQDCCEGGVYYASGAGYKALCVILGLVDVYVFTEDSTYKWDSCGPHALLRSMGGGMADLKECLRHSPAGGAEERPELQYNTPIAEASGTEKWANRDGLVAYRSKADLEAVLQLLTTVEL